MADKIETIEESDDYYESGSVGKTRSSYSCAHCSNTIAKGSACDTHKFQAPEYYTSRTHKKCTKAYLNSCECEQCGGSDLKENMAIEEVNGEDVVLCGNCNTMGKFKQI